MLLYYYVKTLKTTIATTHLLKRNTCTVYANTALRGRLQPWQWSKNSSAAIMSSSLMATGACCRCFRHALWPGSRQPYRSNPARRSREPPGTGRKACRASGCRSRRPMSHRCSSTCECRCGCSTDSKGWWLDSRRTGNSARSMSGQSSQPPCPPCSTDRRTWWCRQNSCWNSRTARAGTMPSCLHIHNNYMHCNYICHRNVSICDKSDRFMNGMIRIRAWISYRIHFSTFQWEIGAFKHQIGLSQKVVDKFLEACKSTAYMLGSVISSLTLERVKQGTVYFKFCMQIHHASTTLNWGMVRI